MHHRLAVAPVSVGLAPWPVAARQAPTNPITIQGWPLAWGGRTRDPSVDPQGRVWFVGQTGNCSARFDPAAGQFKRVEIDSGTSPHTVVIGRQGNAWCAGNRNAMIRSD